MSNNNNAASFEKQSYQQSRINSNRKELPNQKMAMTSANRMTSLDSHHGGASESSQKQNNKVDLNVLLNDPIH